MPFDSGPRFAVNIVGSSGIATFPPAVALADDTANPTTTGVAAYCFGFDGTTWDRLRTEVSFPNLRVALFDGASKINIALPNADNVTPTTYNGLATVSFGHVFDGTNWDRETSLAGTHANAWNAAVLTGTANSTALLINHWPIVTVFGNLSALTGTWDLILQVSQDNINWYDAEEPLVAFTAAQDFEFTIQCASQYVRLRLVEAVAGGVTVTATIAAKRG
jgi:hypothetical protein